MNKIDASRIEQYPWHSRGFSHGKSVAPAFTAMGTTSHAVYCHLKKIGKMKMSNMKVGVKLALSFGVILVLMLVTAGTATWRIQQINQRVTDIVDDRAVKVNLAAELDHGVNVQARYLRNAIIGYKDPEELSSSLKKVEKSVSDNTETLAKLEKMINTPIGRKLFDAMIASRAPYAKARNEAIELLKAGNAEEAGQYVLKTLRPVQNDLIAAIAAFSDAQQKLMVTSGAEAKADGEAAINICLSISALALLTATGLGFALTRSLTTQLGGEPMQAQAIASAIATGDLTSAVDVRYGDMTSLMSRIDVMQQSLQKLVSGVRHSSEAVSVASTQIAQGGHELSSRTEEQASALEETAATMEQLGTAVRTNAESAKHANQLAQSASQVASHGGEVVGKVVATMQGISESSRKIGEIIGVIDSIAFQTNILALNAAVEAARAGEQGRGFAVVASEVRNLAQRSAEAAKEISALIGESVDQVEKGTVLVGQAGATMGEIVESIQQVSAIVGEIASACSEQSFGVQQVCEAVSQMDQVTQQNAALVEESAAAAESLKDQAHQLVETVSVF
ncbi:MAG: MCP four helix bundle domain-containing protein, partial [Burkholderiales bacterium]|nr:MCP four helix bundle domain-containing protein [Burkholderiales bacterium]